MTMLYGSKIEDVLQQLEKDIITPKFAGIKHTAVVALGKLFIMNHFS